MPCVLASLRCWLLWGEYPQGMGTNNSEANMENQHRKIKGYRELDESQIDMMNEVKAMGECVGKLVDLMKHTHDDEDNDAFDQRWVAIGATHFQQGLMALTRAVAKPDFF